MRKKLFYLVIGFITLTMVSCRLEPKMKPLTVTLATFAKQDSTGKWNLLGVKEQCSDKVIIEPDDYTLITADDYFITCIKIVDGVKQIWVYRFNGECLGWFDTYNYISSPGNYCIATNYNRSCYYFPKTKTLIRTTNTYSSVNYLFLEDDDNWKVFTYDGDLVSTLPLETKIISNLTSEGKEIVYIVSEGKEKVTLAKLNSKDKKVYSLKDWLNQLPNFKVAKELPHLVVLEAKNFPEAKEQ